MFLIHLIFQHFLGGILKRCDIRFYIKTFYVLAKGDFDVGTYIRDCKKDIRFHNSAGSR